MLSQVRRDETVAAYKRLDRAPLLRSSGERERGEVDAGRPALAAAVQRARCVACQVHAGRVEQCARLGIAQAEIVAAELE